MCPSTNQMKKIYTSHAHTQIHAQTEVLLGHEKEKYLVICSKMVKTGGYRIKISQTQKEKCLPDAVCQK